jgi:hypothetical protein
MDTSRLIRPVRQTGNTVVVWSSSGRSMRGGAMKSDIASPMKPLGPSFRDSESNLSSLEVITVLNDMPSELE